MSRHAERPLVSCIMPTGNRREFVPLAIRYFLRQDYEPKELVVVDDGEQPVDDLLPRDERISYHRLPRRLTVGAKRNFACERARGTIIAHWDDDDWYAPHRLGRQVEALARGGADVCGTNDLLFYDVVRADAWRYVYPPESKTWVSGSTLCYTREFWERYPFDNIDVGEDACFVWSAAPERVRVMADKSLHVGIIHGKNVSPKETWGSCWRPFQTDGIRRLLGEDWTFYGPAGKEAAAALPPTAPPSHVTPLRNVYACLVHESPECVVDLVRNLRYHDPDSAIILYDGGRDPSLLNHGFPFERYGASVHPSPRPMSWGWLHQFALDCMRFALERFDFDTLTVVDSDQLAVGAGYAGYLAKHLRGRPGVGMLGNHPARQDASTRIEPAAQAWKEFELWRPFLRRFARGEEKFVHWTFWPTTVFTRDAARDLLSLFDTDEQLAQVMRRSEIWATEEVVLPTLIALLGYEVAANPCSYEYVRYRVPYTLRHVEDALRRPEVFWLHPVPRRYEDKMRKYIRDNSEHYEQGHAAQDEPAPRPEVAHDPGAANTPDSPPQREQPAPRLLLTLPILSRMRAVEGWLDDDEADLLIAAAAHALATLPGPAALVEVGSYCGRSTVVLASVAQSVAPDARVYAIDPHDGVVGAADQGVVKGAPTLEKFVRNITAAGVEGLVSVITKCSYEVEWERPISLMLIDGLHDYVNVARDFFHFEKWVADGGYVAFHDYADYYPGVQTFVNEILRGGQYRRVECARSMIVVQKVGPGGAEEVNRG